MKPILLCLGVVLASIASYAQQSIPNIQWQKCFGGSSDEANSRLLIARDKNHFIVGGSTLSTNGDMARPNAPQDIWVAKLDLSGNIVWKTIIDGKGYEALRSLTETSDGSILVFGNSRAEPVVDTNDAMLTKLAPDGRVLWKKYYGGSGEDIGEKLIETRDGSYVFIGSSRSTNGHLAGMPVANELWVGKLNKDGDPLWNKKYPRTFAAERERGRAIEEDPNGNLYVGANLNTGFIVAKLTPAGDTLWRKVLQGVGSSNSIYTMKMAAPDKLMVAGQVSNVSADFPGPGLGWLDGFLMSLDALGNTTFFKRYGGYGTDDISDFAVLADGSYLTVGSTTSSNGYLASDSSSFEDVWTANIAPNGQVRWARKFGGNSYDYGIHIGALSESSMVFFGLTRSNDLDVSGNHGGWDLWLAKLGNTSTLKGSVYYDDNSNGTKDASEPWVHNILVNVSKAGYNRSTAAINGQFALEVDTGSYSITAALPYYTATPVTKTFSAYFQSDSISIGLRPQAGKQDLQVDLVPLVRARPGFDITYRILYRNRGTTTLQNATLRFVKSSKLTVLSTAPTFSASAADTFSWNLATLAPRDTGSVVLHLRVAAPPTVNIGDTLSTYASIEPVAGDETPMDNLSRLKQVVAGSFDPNDKQEASGGAITQAQAALGEYLTYMIRFQNTGTDTAFRVSVRDTLDSKLDWSTLEMIAASHPYQLVIKDGNQLHWQFNSILLPDSRRNEPASHGFIAYKIKARSSTAVGDQIRNDASIYFDYNLPVVTNEFITTIMANVPDLDITSSASPATVTVGGVVTASFTVSNTGAGTAGTSKVFFYQSVDQALTPGAGGDVLLGSYDVASLAAGASTGAVSRALPIPCTQSPGTYYIFLVADGEGLIGESNEANNTNSHALAVQALEVTVTPAAPTICAGASVALTASGAAAYSWSPAAGLSATSGAAVSASPTSTSTYTVTGTSGTCQVSRSVTVTVTPVVTPAISIAASGCPSNTISFQATVTGGGSSPVVEWYVNNILAGSGSSFTLNNAQNGTQVYARLTSTAACASPQSVNSTTETVNCITTAVPTIDGVEAFSVGGNPTKGAFVVRLKLTQPRQVAFTVRDLFGRVVYRSDTGKINGASAHTIDLQREAVGTYFLNIRIGKSEFTEKIVKVN